MLIYEVNRVPEMRREMSQLQRCVGSGREDIGTLKVWDALPQWQDTASSLVSLIASELDLRRLGEKFQMIPREEWRLVADDATLMKLFGASLSYRLVATTSCQAHVSPAILSVSACGNLTVFHIEFTYI